MKTTKTKRGFTDGYKRYDTSSGFGDPREWKKAFHSRMTGDEARKIIEAQTETPYTILDISSGATQAEIKSAFRRLISVWHPDKNPHNIEHAEEMSKKIIAAYTVLIN